jgi:hypothetical protein
MYATANTMYVGGSFTNAGGIPAADRIAKWNGNAWSAIGPAIANNGSVFAIAVHDGKVYAGGNFTDAGGEPTADYLAVFDGVSWEPFCNAGGVPAFDLQVLALQVIDSNLYVGGTFQNANGIPSADYLVACDLNSGSPHSTVDGGGDFTGPVYDLATTSDGTLYAGGNFINLDGVVTADHVASYKGAWSGLGSTPIGGTVRGLHANGMDLYVSSDGSNIGDPRSDHLVKWNGSEYSPVGSDNTGANGYFPPSATVNEITMSGSLLFAAGSWQNANGAPTGDMIAYFNGTIWRPLGTNGASPPNGALNANTEGLAVFGGQLYAGGTSTNAGGDSKANFAASRSLRLPDAAISGPTGPEVGNNVFNSTATGQSKAIEIPRGTSKTFRIVVWNDGIVPTTFTLNGSGAAKGYSIKYIEDSSGTHGNITTAVKNGNYVTPTVAETSGFPMNVVVKLSSNAARKGSFVVKASSMPNHPVDAVKGVVNAK